MSLTIRGSLACVLLFLFVSPAAASNYECIIGVTEFDVLIEGLSESAERIGLTEKLVRTATELRLRAAKLPVVPMDDRRRGRKAYLYVNLNVIGDETVAANVVLEFKVYVSTDSCPNTWFPQQGKPARVSVSAWDGGTLLLLEGSARDARMAILDTIREHADSFANHFLEVQQEFPAAEQPSDAQKGKSDGDG